MTVERETKTPAKAKGKAKGKTSPTPEESPGNQGGKVKEESTSTLPEKEQESPPESQKGRFTLPGHFN